MHYRYLVTMPSHEPFYTDYFEPENHFTPGMVVYDLREYLHTTDGLNWTATAIDQL